jgi:hypothetical protein
LKENLLSSYAVKTASVHRETERPTSPIEKTMRMNLTSRLFSMNQPHTPQNTAAISAAKIRSVKVKEAIHAPLLLSLPISLLKMAKIPSRLRDKKLRYHEIP